MLRKIRITAAILCMVGITMLFTDLSGTAAPWLGWLAKIQFLPALLALNVGVLAALVAVTLLFGRVYCSVICPLGVMQDCFAWFGKRSHKNRYSHSPAISWLRYLFLGITVAAVIAGTGTIVALLAPYSAYGRIANSFLQPLWIYINNLLAQLAEKHDSYAFATAAFHPQSAFVIAVAAVTLVTLAILAWRNGRTYCNTVCPVGTVLGFLSRFSVIKPVIDTSKCNGCGLCARNCKSACIDSRGHAIDYSRCVSCMDCIDKCRRGAITYSVAPRRKSASPATGTDSGRRSFIAITAATAASAALKAQEKTVDGGLAAIEQKKIPARKTKIVPPGAVSLNHLARHCTACQLCVSACPNGVLRPSTDLERLLQPEASYENGYCRPECNRCSQVCPAGAIKPIDVAEKSSIQIGHAVWIKENCVVLTDGVSCGNCATHCPAGAIQMIPSRPGDPDSPKIPAVSEEACIGCGACENLCPARPFSAIYVEGHKAHRTI